MDKLPAAIASLTVAAFFSGSSAAKCSDELMLQEAISSIFVRKGAVCVSVFQAEIERRQSACDQSKDRSAPRISFSL